MHNNVKVRLPFLTALTIFLNTILLVRDTVIGSLLTAYASNLNRFFSLVTILEQHAIIRFWFFHGKIAIKISKTIIRKYVWRRLIGSNYCVGTVFTITE